MSKIGQTLIEVLVQDQSDNQPAEVLEMEKPDADIVAAAFESQEQPNF